MKSIKSYIYASDLIGYSSDMVQKIWIDSDSALDLLTILKTIGFKNDKILKKFAIEAVDISDIETKMNDRMKAAYDIVRGVTFNKGNLVEKGYRDLKNVSGYINCIDFISSYRYSSWSRLTENNALLIACSFGDNDEIVQAITAIKLEGDAVESRMVESDSIVDEPRPDILHATLLEVLMGDGMNAARRATFCSEYSEMPIGDIEAATLRSAISWEQVKDAFDRWSWEENFKKISREKISIEA